MRDGGGHHLLLSTFERRRAKPSPHSRASAQLLPARQRSVWWSSCVCTWQSTRTQSTRPPHSTSGRWRHQAGAEQAALSTELHCRVRHSHPTLSSLDRQEEHHRAHTRLACGGAGQHWFFLRQSWLGSSPLTQRNHSPPPSRQPRCRRRHHRRRGLWLRSVVHMAPCTTAICQRCERSCFRCV